MRTKTNRTYSSASLIRLLLVGSVVLLLTTFSNQATLAQIGPGTVWEEGVQVPVGENEPTSSSIQAAPTTPGTHYRTYSGTAFQPSASALTYAPIGGAIYVTAIPSGGYSLNVELLLPQGATITELVFYFQDNDATNIFFQLRSFSPDNNSFLTLEDRSSAGASAGIRTLVVGVDPPIIVDNTKTSYRLRVVHGVPNSNHLLYGARVGYTVPTIYMPLIER